jgi:hypothetical protein
MLAARRGMQAPWVVEPAEPAVAGQPGIPRSHLEDLGHLPPPPPSTRRTDLQPGCLCILILAFAGCPSWHAGPVCVGGAGGGRPLLPRSPC